MARPLDADAALTKAKILRSAGALFADVGVEGASVRDVVTRAGVSVAMVNHYFGSKDRLYDACVEAVYAELAELRTELERELASGGSPHELVDRAVVTTFRFAREHRVAVRLLVRGAVGAGELPKRGREQLMAFLDVASRGFAVVSGRRAAELRLPLQSIVFLVARFAVQGDPELAAVAGTTERAAASRVERHLVDVATRLLFDPSPKRRP